MQSKGLSAAGRARRSTLQNLILPSGTAKIGQIEYDVELNGSPRTVAELNDLPDQDVSGTPRSTCAMWRR